MLKTDRVVAMILALTVMVGANAFATIDLVVTEVDPYGTDRNTGDPTEPDDIEWIEVTNFGTTTYDAAVHGALYYDDYAPDASKADPVSEVTMIAPGESVILMNIDPGAVDPMDPNPPNNFTFADGVAFFQADPVFAGYTGQFGWYDGSGMSSSNADGGSIFLEYPLMMGDPATINFISTLNYDAGTQVAGQTFTALGWGPASPGEVVPEPATLALVFLGAMGLLGFRRR